VGRFNTKENAGLFHMIDPVWWQHAVFYQVYLRSFADSNGDGIGDLNGIIQRLDYLQDLGIDAIWLSPHYPSPLLDYGYDVSDYLKVAPEYGDLDDFKRLLEGLHKRGMYLVTDFVLNHTSDQHPWFLESCSSQKNSKRDWYIWKDCIKDRPPNNWYSWFGGSAWEFDPATNQSYYHFFFKQQPDLNWRNAEVKAAMLETMRYWLELGVDGFRLDALGMIFEAPDIPNQESGMTQQELYHLSRMAKSRDQRTQVARASRKMFRYQMDLPELHGLLREIRHAIDEYPGKVLVGETELVEYYGSANDELHLVFNFPLTRMKKLTPSAVLCNQFSRLTKLPAGDWPCNTLGNHDISRLLSRYGDGNHDIEIARLCLALVLTLPGTPFLYNGEEIGMLDYLVNDISQVHDRIGLWTYGMEIDEMGYSPEQALAYALEIGRDKCRTPFQWDNSSNAGFCPAEATPWLPVNSNYADGVNAADQARTLNSLLNSCRSLLKARKRTPALVYGDFQPLKSPPGCLAFFRGGRGVSENCMVVLNMSKGTRVIELPIRNRITRLVYSTHSREKELESFRILSLFPFEVFIAVIN
jgi:alpha-glucosidase